MGLDPNSTCDGPLLPKNVYANSDDYFGIYVYFNTNPLMPFDFTGATEIKVTVPNIAGTFTTLKLSLGQVQIFKAQAGQIRAFYSKAQSVLWALGIQDVQIVATISGQDKVMIALGAINVIAERYPGV